MFVSRRCIRFVGILVLGLWILAGAPQLRAQAGGLKVLKTFATWCRTQIAALRAGKEIDQATGQNLSRQAEKEIRQVVARISTTTGANRAVYMESLVGFREQLAVYSQLGTVRGQRLEELQTNQEQLLDRIERLEPRIEALEGRVDRIDTRVDELDARLSQVENALIRDCLDLRSAALLGEDEYRIKESPGGWKTERFESDELSLDLRLLLNSCSADLTRRGLVIQLAMVTRDLDSDLKLYVNWKGVGAGGYTLGPPRLLDRQEIPLGRPSYRVDGKVVELFFPYDGIPGFGTPDRLALALVLTHDGTVLYTLPDQVISCVFGQRVQCRWGR